MLCEVFRTRADSLNLIPQAVLIQKTPPGLFRLHGPFCFQLVAMDAGGRSGSLSSTAQLTVVVEDTNDHGPEFSEGQYVINVLESQVSSSSVGYITAVDRDAGVNGRIYYSVVSGGEGMFYIDTLTGLYKALLRSCLAMQPRGKNRDFWPTLQNAMNCSETGTVHSGMNTCLSPAQKTL